MRYSSFLQIIPIKKSRRKERNIKPPFVIIIAGQKNHQCMLKLVAKTLKSLHLLISKGSTVTLEWKHSSDIP